MRTSVDPFWNFELGICLGLGFWVLGFWSWSCISIAYGGHLPRHGLSEQHGVPARPQLEQSALRLAGNVAPFEFGFDFCISRKLAKPEMNVRAAAARMAGAAIDLPGEYPPIGQD